MGTRERLPAVYTSFRTHRFDLLYMTSLEGEVLRRVWDVLLCDGIEALFRVAVALLSHRADAIIKARSMDDLIHLFQDGKDDTAPEVLIQTAYNAALVGTINRSELAQRRSQALTKVSSDDTRAEMRNQKLWRGGVRPASVLAR